MSRVSEWEVERVWEWESESKREWENVRVSFEHRHENKSCSLEWMRECESASWQVCKLFCMSRVSEWEIERVWEWERVSERMWEWLLSIDMKVSEWESASLQGTKYISLDPQLQVLIGKLLVASSSLQIASLQSPRCFYWPPLLLVSLKTRVALCNLFGQSHPGYLSWLSPPHTHNTSWWWWPIKRNEHVCVCVWDMDMV